MSKWPMRGHFRYVRFKTFLVTPKTLQCEVFWALPLSSKHSGIPEGSKPPLFQVLGFTPYLAKVGLRHIARVAISSHRCNLWCYNSRHYNLTRCYSATMAGNVAWQRWWAALCCSTTMAGVVTKKLFLKTQQLKSFQPPPLVFLRARERKRERKRKREKELWNLLEDTSFPVWSQFLWS